MAPGMPMAGPVCLLENRRDKMVLNPEALEILSGISQPVVVVAIVGLYRTGKSYLMNKLVGRNQGFSLGNTVQSHTKGIWMWCIPHPQQPGKILVVLDTEGLGDVEKGDSANDSWIFALAILLSSMFVFNSMGTINQQAIEQLHYVSELTEKIRVKSSPRDDGLQDSSDFVSFFPDFVWAVRDFSLQLVMDGHTITEDEYLENALKFRPGKHRKVEEANMSRECIRLYFRKRKCFVFDQPTTQKGLLARLEEVQEDQLSLQFRQQVQRFCSYVFTDAKTKCLGEGIPVSGTWLGELAKTYVDAIARGDMPCLENAVLVLAKLENTAAVRKATLHYEQLMNRLVHLPTETQQELLDLHAACEKEALQIFMRHSFKDDKRDFQKSLMENLQRIKEDTMQKNELVSFERCNDEIKHLSEPLKKHISQGKFSVPGGYKCYLEEKKAVVDKYQKVPGKGIKADEVLQNFLKSESTMGEAILQADEALSEQEKATAAACALREAAEEKQKLLKQQQEELEQRIKYQERTYEENIIQLKKKLEEDRRQMLESQEQILQHKLKAHEAMLNEGFRDKAKKLQTEIDNLKKQQEDNKQPSFISSALDVLGTVMTIVLPGVGKLAGLGLSLISRRFK
ncbi:guanylate-binding protein 4-like [Tachyglossus aculeatus]|uniref:guanylate-binding protein 4-like n=1 Tax=Tachyglossus aculeatus TaxID=9261 RepID=UPI0018F60BC3|nr:guanylate-binding protein 4-like [Tachyglossus aculeatus]